MSKLASSAALSHLLVNDQRFPIRWEYRTSDGNVDYSAVHGETGAGSTGRPELRPRIAEFSVKFLEEVRDDYKLDSEIWNCGLGDSENACTHLVRPIAGAVHLLSNRRPFDGEKTVNGRTKSYLGDGFIREIGVVWCPVGIAADAELGKELVLDERFGFSIKILVGHCQGSENIEKATGKNCGKRKSIKGQDEIRNGR
ncbi:hypothetical protein B0H19DRAFT_1244285 [Mycena capillaripes]|nr:hypothetical protein B0H19DRAFT_1244285 [Mycena capillaripes]